MSADGFVEMICWWCASKMTTISVSSAWISPIDCVWMVLRIQTPYHFVWKVCKRRNNMRVSASSWLHYPIDLPSFVCFTQSSPVMYSSFRSGNCPVDSILDRYLKSSFCCQHYQKHLPVLRNFCRIRHTLPTAVSALVIRAFFNGYRIVTVSVLSMLFSLSEEHFPGRSRIAPSQ